SENLLQFYFCKALVYIQNRSRDLASSPHYPIQGYMHVSDLSRNRNKTSSTCSVLQLLARTFCSYFLGLCLTPLTIFCFVGLVLRLTTPYPLQYIL
ncbi:hypothetical protein LEMLEM_LOCUS22031, partial [Lemmus lemmus]